jgi:hypothetical protein
MNRSAFLQRDLLRRGLVKSTPRLLTLLGDPLGLFQFGESLRNRAGLGLCGVPGKLGLSLVGVMTCRFLENPVRLGEFISPILVCLLF